jgi:hypothetical protein
MPRIDGTHTPHTRDRLIIMVFFLLNIAMVYPVFFPSLNQINGWDEAFYLERGRELVGGVLPQFSENPAVAALYAMTYLPFMNSPQWLVQTDTLGRLVLFTLLWISSFLVARKLVDWVNPLTMMAFVAISTVVVQLLTNGSDALFAAMSAFALWQFLSFRRAQRPVHLALCSVFVGLAALSRPEGSMLFVVFVGLSAAACLCSRPRLKCAMRHSAAVLVPFSVLVGGYVGVYGMRTGSFTLGAAERAYLAFEQGHGIAFASSYGTLNPYVEGQKDARRLFGTAEENHYSILKAIQRNPSAYLQRIPRLGYGAFTDLVQAYQWHFAVFCFAFAVRGIIALLQGRSYGLLAILLLWPASNLLHILIIYQVPHLLIPFVNVCALTGIGVTAAARNLDSRLERRWWIIGLLALTVVGTAMYRRPNDLLLAPLLVWAALWVTWLVAQQVHDDATTRMRVTCLVLIAGALFVRFGVVHAAVPARGSSPDERATTWLREHLRPGTQVGSYAPGAVWAASMTPVTLELSDMTTAEAFWAWVTRENIAAIYVDERLRTLEPVAWQTIRSQIGYGIDVAFDNAPNRPTVDWRNAAFHVSRPSESEPVQVLVRTPGAHTK